MLLAGNMSDRFPMFFFGTPAMIVVTYCQRATYTCGYLSGLLTAILTKLVPLRLRLAGRDLAAPEKDTEMLSATAMMAQLPTLGAELAPPPSHCRGKQMRHDTRAPRSIHHSTDTVRSNEFTTILWSPPSSRWTPPQLRGPTFWRQLPCEPRTPQAGRLLG